MSRDCRISPICQLRLFFPRGKEKKAYPLYCFGNCLDPQIGTEEGKRKLNWCLDQWCSDVISSPLRIVDGRGWTSARPLHSQTVPETDRQAQRVNKQWLLDIGEPVGWEPLSSMTVQPGHLQRPGSSLRAPPPRRDSDDSHRCVGSDRV